MRKTILPMMMIIVTAIASGWAFFIYGFVPMIVHDRNGEFFSRLNTMQDPPDPDGIYWAAQGVCRSVMIPLLITNGLWVILATAWFVSHVREQRRAAWNRLVGQGEPEKSA